MSGTPLPQIRIVDAVAAGDSATGLAAADGRLVEFTLAELERLVVTLGSEGLEALCAYLRVLRKETGPDGRVVLVVDEFSGSWVQAHTTLGRNAAYRGQKALEDAELLVRVVSRPGHGARGKQRAILNSGLVLVPGGADGDVSSLRTARPGRPVSRRPRNRETGAEAPVSPDPGNRQTGPVPRFAGTRETGEAAGASAQVSAGFPAETSAPSTASTSSEYSSVVEQLLSSDSGPGLLARTLRPALRRNRAHVEERLRDVLNSANLVDRLDPLVVPLRLDGPRTQRTGQLAAYLADVLLAERDPATELTKLHVQGRRRNLPPEVLAERLVVGIVVGLGMDRPVDQWGAWLHKATRPDWSPKPNRLLGRFADALERIDRDSSRAVSAPPASPPSEEPSGRVAADPDPGASEVELDAETVAAHLDDALGAFPQYAALCGNDRPNSARHRERVVRIYLTQSKPDSAAGAADHAQSA